MRVSEAVKKRITTRAFLQKPVPLETIQEILEISKYAPSGGNVQPWKVYVLGGAARDDFVSLIRQKMMDQPSGEGTEYVIYPPKLKEPYRTRRYKCGEDLYATINIPREDKMARLMQLAKNYEFFGAPIGLFFTIERIMGLGQWSDLGMFIQTVMLVAEEFGVQTCAQEAWARWYKTLGEYLNLADEEMLFCGMAMGYADRQAPINSLRTDRAPLEEFASFRGFD